MKEYHVTFQYDMEQPYAKNATRRIEKLMEDSGAEKVSKNDDDGYMALSFHFITGYDKMFKVCTEALNSVKTTDTKVSVYVYDHTPGALINPKDVKNKEEFQQFLDKLTQEHQAVSVQPYAQDDKLIKVTFPTSKQSNEFQQAYNVQAAVHMKKGHSGVHIESDWNDEEILTKNNYSEGKKLQRY